MTDAAVPWSRVLVQLRHAGLSLGQHKLRSALSMLGVVCGVVSFLVMVGAGEGAKRETLAQIEQLGMKNILIKAAVLGADEAAADHEKGSQGLSLSDEEHLEPAVPGIRQVAALRELALPVHAAARELAPEVLAVTPNFAALQSLGMQAGRFLAESDARDRALVCVLGYQSAMDLGGQGKPGASLQLGNALYQVVGVLRRQGRRGGGNSAVSTRDFDNTVLLPLGERDPGAFDLTEMVVGFSSGDQVLPSVQLVKRVMQVLHHGVEDYRVVVPQELLRQAAQTRRTFDLLLGSIALASLVAGGIGIMNIMLANIAERTYEIGLRRALGATRGRILAQFLAEAALLTLAGGLLGQLLGLGVIALAGPVLGTSFHLTAWAMAAPLLMSLLMGLGFGWYPAAKAARMDPIEALRH